MFFYASSPTARKPRPFAKALRQGAPPLAAWAAEPPCSIIASQCVFSVPRFFVYGLRTVGRQTLFRAAKPVFADVFFLGYMLVRLAAHSRLLAAPLECNRLLQQKGAATGFSGVFALARLTIYISELLLRANDVIGHDAKTSQPVSTTVINAHWTGIRRQLVAVLVAVQPSDSTVPDSPQDPGLCIHPPSNAIRSAVDMAGVAGQVRRHTACTKVRILVLR